MGKIQALGKFRGTIDPRNFPITRNFPVVSLAENINDVH